MKEIREKLEVMHKKKDKTIARGEAAVQKIMKEVCCLLRLSSKEVQKASLKSKSLLEWFVVDPFNGLHIDQLWHSLMFILL